MFDRYFPWKGDFNKSHLKDLLKEYDTFCVFYKNLHIYGVSYDKKYILYLSLDYSNNGFRIDGRALRFHNEEEDLAAHTMLDIRCHRGITGESAVLLGEVFYLNGKSNSEAFTLYYINDKNTSYKQVYSSARFSQTIKSAILGHSAPQLRLDPGARFIDTKSVNGIEFNIT